MTLLNLKTQTSLKQSIAQSMPVIVTVPDNSVLDIVNDYLSSLLPSSLIETVNDSESLTIEHVRELKGHLSLSKTGTNHVYCIDLTKSASNEAQNALLKLLEELHSYTKIVIYRTVHSKVLKTIESRSTKVDVAPTTEAQVQELYPKSGKEYIEKLYSFSNGDIAVILKYIYDQELFEAHIQQAKNYITASPIDKIQILEKELKAKSIDSYVQTLYSLSRATLSVSSGSPDNWKKLMLATHEYLLNTNKRVNQKLNMLQLAQNS